MKVYTIKDGNIIDGVVVGSHVLLNGTSIPVVRVGEHGRGRKLGIIPISLPQDLYAEWKEGKTVVVYHVKETTTQKGTPKLIAIQEDDGVQDILCVFLSKIGFRGYNSHTGDIITTHQDKDNKYEPFPGRILVSGIIAQGAAGMMGAGSQLVAVIQPNTIFRVGYGGRLYGAPNEYFYYYDGVKVIAATKDERESLDLF